MKLKLTLLLFLFTIPFGGVAYSASATYYLSQGGATAKASATTNCTTSMSVAAHNAATFAAGDTIKLCDNGGDIIETIIIPSSGTAGNPITYTSADGENVVMRGDTASITGTFTNTMGNEYSVPMATEPAEIYHGDTLLKGGYVRLPDSWVTSNQGCLGAGNPFTCCSGAGAGTCTGWTIQTDNYKSLFCPDHAVENPATSPVYLDKLEDTTTYLETPLASNEFWCDGTDKYFAVNPASGSPSGKGNGYIKLLISQAGSLEQGSYYWDDSTNLLHVRMLNDAVPQSGDLTMATLDNCIQATNKDNLTFNNIGLCKKTEFDGISISVVDTGKSNYTFNNIRTENTGWSGIEMNFTDATITAYNISITNSNISKPLRREHYVWRPTGTGSFDSYLTREVGAITLRGAATGLWVGQHKIDGLEILNNTVNYGPRVYTQEQFDRWVASGWRTPVYARGAINFKVNGNYVYGGDHSIFVSSAPNYDCGISKVNYNYVDKAYDDAIWVSQCYGNTPDKFLVASNIILSEGDDCVDMNASHATIINNTCINSANDGSCMEFMTTTSLGVYKNNLCVFTTLPGTGTHYFVRISGGGLASQWEYNNNIYYYDGSDDELSFHELGGLGSVTFAGWKAHASAPDANSYFIVEPKLNSLYAPKYASIARSNGTDLSAYGIELLMPQATWPNPQTRKPAGIWPIGAYYNSSMISNGVTFNGVTLK